MLIPACFVWRIQGVILLIHSLNELVLTSGFACDTALGAGTSHCHWQQGVYVTVSECIASETLCCLGTEGLRLTFLFPHSNFQIPYFSVDLAKLLINEIK